MFALEYENSAKIKLITGKIEFINREAANLLGEVQAISERNYSKMETINFNEEVKRFEIELIKYALFLSKGNQKLAAKILNLKPTTLNAKIKKLKMDDVVF